MSQIIECRAAASQLKILLPGGGVQSQNQLMLCKVNDFRKSSKNNERGS